MNKNIYRLTIPLKFGTGLIPGAEFQSNYLLIARNGANKPVLHGSSIAGVLRNALKKSGVNNIESWFGKGCNDNLQNETSSRVKVSDSILDTGNSDVVVRTHNAINRHTGAAINKSLYSLESLPPGTKGVLSIEVNGRDMDKEICDTFINDIIKILETDLYFGGNKNRGVGLATVDAGVCINYYDLSIKEDYAKYLDACYTRNATFSTIINSSVPTNCNQFKIQLVLGIPRGEDLLVGDGQTLDYELEPQRVLIVDGNEYWKIAGSTFRGIFRAWITRLAARDDKNVIDNVITYCGDEENNIPERSSDEYTIDNIGWAFKKNKEIKDQIAKEPSLLNDPIYSLFGSFYKQGRIHFTDALSKKAIQEGDDDERMHVAIDRITGGSIEGSLFANKVLINSKNSKIEFQLNILIDEPTEDEKKWLLKTLKAIHLGIISVGSSKSSGRLAIKQLASTTDNHFKIELEKFLETHK
jgi:CRISPR/Cas system CSM-associated protein Csm3 (group 7 of RAMP superfamily)